MVVRFAPDGGVTWFRSYVGTGPFGGVLGLATDSAGAIYVIGNGQGVDFGGGPVDGPYLAKLSSDGAHIWSRPVALKATAANMYLTTVQSLPGGDVLLGGSAVGTFDLGAGLTFKLQTLLAPFVVTFDASGAAKQLGVFPGTGHANAKAAVVATDGTLLLGGRMGGTLTFPGVPPLVGAASMSSTLADAYVARFAWPL